MKHFEQVACAFGRGQLFFHRGYKIGSPAGAKAATAEPLLRILSLVLLQSRRDYMFIAQSPRYVQNPEGIVCQYVAHNI